MKTLILGFIVLLCSTSFVAAPIRTVSASTTISTSDNGGVVTNTGGSVTFTLGSVSNDFTCLIANDGTGTITFSSAITVANGKTTTTLGNSNSTFTPNNLGNRLFIWYDGTTWRGR